MEEVLWSMRGSYQTIWSSPFTNVKWQSVTCPYTMTTPYWSDFVPISAFYRIWKVSIEHLRRVWHADSGRLLLRTPGPVPLGLSYVQLIETNPFFRTLFFATMIFEYPSVLSRFCLGLVSFLILRPFSPELVMFPDCDYRTSLGISILLNC